MWKWKKLEKEEIGQKWVIEFNDILLASIFHKQSNNKFSVYVYTPMIFEKVLPMVGQTWLLDTFEEAQKLCEKELENTVVPWAKAMTSCWEKSNEDVA